MSEPLLLDTCALLFLASGVRLDREVQRTLTAAMDENRPVLISPISAWEIGMLVAGGRMSLPVRPEKWFAEAMDRGGMGLAPMTPDILIGASFLPRGINKDPADRIIVATARETGAILVTRNRQLLHYAQAGNLKALPC